MTTSSTDVSFRRKRKGPSSQYSFSVSLSTLTVAQSKKGPKRLFGPVGAGVGVWLPVIATGFVETTVSSKELLSVAELTSAKLMESINRAAIPAARRELPSPPLCLPNLRAILECLVGRKPSTPSNVVPPPTVDQEGELRCRDSCRRQPGDLCAESASDAKLQRAARKGSPDLPQNAIKQNGKVCV